MRGFPRSHSGASPVANRNVVAIGTSAGGVEALLYLTKQFSSELPAAVLITVHLPNDLPSALDEVLGNAGRIPVSFAEDGEELEDAHIYLAPPNRHLLVEDQNLVLGKGPPENWARPAIDPMMRSVAVCCGSRSIGVILTGALGDGASGLQAIRQCGGIAVVQDPRDAFFSEMPFRALNLAAPHYVARLSKLPALLKSLVHQPSGDPMPCPTRLKFEVKVAKGEGSIIEELKQIGHRSVLSCPECGGVMWEIEEGNGVRYRCHVGHALSAEAINFGITDKVREALYIALRALDEQAALTNKLLTEAAAKGRNLSTNFWLSRKEETDRQRDVLRSAINHTDEITFQSVEESEKVKETT